MARDLSVDLDIAAALDAARTGAEKGIAAAVEHLLNASNEHVPHEYGDLQSSGVASTDGLEGAVSYNTPYAVRQHEELTWRHNDGRTAKYLENAMNSEAETMGGIIADQIRANL